MQLPLLIGQAPGPNTDPELPLFPIPHTSTGGKLQQMMGLSRGHYLMGFDRVNLLQQFPGRTGRDDKFPLGKARVAAGAMKRLLPGRTVLLVGRNVATAFDLDIDFLTWHHTDYCERIAVVPHLSGRNHWYNKPENKAAARDFLTRFAEEHVPDKNLLPSLFQARIKQQRLLEAVRAELTMENET